MHAFTQIYTSSLHCFSCTFASDPVQHIQEVKSCVLSNDNAFMYGSEDLCCVLHWPLPPLPQWTEPTSTLSYSISIKLFFLLALLVSSNSVWPLLVLFSDISPSLTLTLSFSPSPYLYSQGVSDSSISFYTNLSAPTVAQATHHCHGNPGGLEEEEWCVCVWEGGGDRRERKIRKSGREKERKRVTHLFSLSDKEVAVLLIFVPLQLYQHRISRCLPLRVNNTDPVHLVA